MSSINYPPDVTGNEPYFNPPPTWTCSGCGEVFDEKKEAGIKDIYERRYCRECIIAGLNETYPGVPLTEIKDMLDCPSKSCKQLVDNFKKAVILGNQKQKETDQ